MPARSLRNQRDWMIGAPASSTGGGHALTSGDAKDRHLSAACLGVSATGVLGSGVRNALEKELATCDLSHSERRR